MADNDISINAAPVDITVSAAQGPSGENFASNKATIANGDKFTMLDSAATDAPKHALFSLVKSTLKTYFDSLYQAIGSYATAAQGTKADNAVPTPAIITDADNRTLLTTDAWQYIRLTGASPAITVDTTLSGLATGTQFFFRFAGTGTVSITATGTTVSDSASSVDVPIDGNFALIKTGTNSYDFV